MHDPRHTARAGCRMRAEAAEPLVLQMAALVEGCQLPAWRCQGHCQSVVLPVCHLL